MHDTAADAADRPLGGRVPAVRGSVVDEHNIGDFVGELTARYRGERQSAIDAELMDVLAGFEAVSARAPRRR